MPELVELPDEIFQALRQVNLSELQRQAGMRRESLSRLRKRKRPIKIRHDTLRKLQNAPVIQECLFQQGFQQLIKAWSEPQGPKPGPNPFFLLFFYIQNTLEIARRIYNRAADLDLLPPLKLKQRCDEIARLRGSKSIPIEGLEEIILGGAPTLEELCLIAEALETLPSKLFVATPEGKRAFRIALWLATVRDPSDPEALKAADFLPSKLRDLIKAKVKEWHPDPQGAAELHRMRTLLGIRFEE